MTNLRDTSLRALREHRIHLGHDQREVFRVLLDRGPIEAIQGSLLDGKSAASGETE